MVDNPYETPGEGVRESPAADDRPPKVDRARLQHGIIVIVLAVPVLMIATLFTLGGLLAEGDGRTVVAGIAALYGLAGLAAVFIGVRLISRSRSADVDRREERSHDGRKKP